MKTIYYYLSFILLLGIASSCEKESEGLSRITHYVDINLDGDNTVSVPLGSDYTEPGYTAFEGETDVTGQVQIEDNINTSEIGVYDVTYTAVNADNFPSSKSRTVVVYDPSAPDIDLSGTYATTTVRTEADGTNPRPRSLEMTLEKVGTGVFYVNGLMGNYYSIGSDYGPAYAMNGYVNLNSDYTFSLITSHIEGWGDGLEDFRNATYDPETGTIKWDAVYAGADIFAVTGTKK